MLNIRRSKKGQAPMELLVIITLILAVSIVLGGMIQQKYSTSADTISDSMTNSAGELATRLDDLAN